MSRNQRLLFGFGLFISIGSAAVVVLTVVRVALGDITDLSVLLGGIGLLDFAAGLLLLRMSRRPGAH